MMGIAPGDAFAIKINAHRQEWNGQICSRPGEWECGASESFRSQNCARGRPHCFHMNLFAAHGNIVQIAEPKVERLLAEHPSLFDDQLLVFYGARFSPTRVVQSNSDQVVYGMYRIRSARIDTSTPTPTVFLEPYPDGWARFPRNAVRRPRVPSAFEGVTYLARVNGDVLEDLLDEALQAAKTLSVPDRLGKQDMERLEMFSKSLGLWTDTAAKALAKLTFTERLEPDDTKIERSGAPLEGALQQKFKSLLTKTKFRPSPAPVINIHAKSQPAVNESLRSGADNLALSASRDTRDNAQVALAIVPELVIASEVIVPPDPVAAPEVAAAPVVAAEHELVAEPEPITTAEPVGIDLTNWRRGALPEASQVEAIAVEYGAATLKALRFATVTKPLLLLTGATGVGKSRLAPRLLDDPERSRTMFAAVSSTWRGREDLLGYVNPITSEFEPTEFTLFLKRAERAWANGDQRTHVAVLEEFNLSPPEHWLSDLLVRLEYEAHRTADRTIQLGGTKIAGSTDVGTSVYLPPTLLLVGTLNHDHTVRKLSPRVLDRAALIEITSTARAALERSGAAGLSPATVDAIEALNSILKPVGAAFSGRSAASLRDAIEIFGQEEASSALDHVLTQEVLSKVRLAAGDMQDTRILHELQAWAGTPACLPLTLTSSRIRSWSETLDAGLDVFQA